MIADGNQKSVTGISPSSDPVTVKRCDERSAMLVNNIDDALNHWIVCLSPYFSENAKFKVIHTRTKLGILIQWLLITEPDQPVRWRKIILLFTDEAVNEYIYNYAPGSREKSDLRLKALIEDRVRNCALVTNTDLPEMTETWVITNDLLNH